MVGASYDETLRMLRNINFNVPLFDTVSENYFAGDLTRRYLRKESGQRGDEKTTKTSGTE